MSDREDHVTRGKQGMNMTNNEIVRNYQQAKNKRQQIEILADLNETDKDTIKGILKAGGIDLRSANTRAVKIEAADPIPGEVGYVQLPEIKIPLGIPPREIAETLFNESRIKDIIEAIHRYYEAEQPIPEEWRAELKERL